MKENKESIGYYSVIPATVLYNKELKANEKLLYAIITSLACKEGYCFASNKYLAEKLDVNPKTISSWISDLRDKNFVIVELIRNENKQIIQRKIYINDSPYPLNNGYQYQSKNGQAIHQKVEDNNIRNNIKNNNKVKKKIIFNYTNQREYSEESRSYEFRSDNKTFRNCCSNSLYASCLDGTDQGVRLDYYMEYYGNKPGWKVDYCYLVEEEKEVEK